MSERGLEEPEEDANEQRSIEADDDDDAGLTHEPLLDVDEADAAEQERAVQLDEDEYR